MAWRLFHVSTWARQSILCMFDEFHLTFIFKSKVSCDVHKKKIGNAFYSKLSPRFLAIWCFKENRYFDLIKIQSWYVTEGKLSIKRKYPSVSRISPNVQVGSHVHCIRFEPTQRDVYRSYQGPSSSTYYTSGSWLHLVLENLSLKNSYTWWNEYNFLPKLHKFRPIWVPFQIVATNAPSLE